MSPEVVTESARRSDFSIDFAGEAISLLPERAFYWAAQSLLGLSDIHLGKAQSLQRLGLPIPARSHTEDLDRMAQLIQVYRPREVVILGDFIHDRESWSPDLVAELRDFFSRHDETRWNLVIGNHERGSEKYLTQFPLHIFEDEMTRGQLTLAHGHAERPTGFRIEGHVHPVTTIRNGPVRLRLPCFVVDDNRLLIPSFGVLTGGFEIEEKNNRLFAVTPKEVFEVKGRF